ncbi:MAG: hypothetical protein CSA21_00060 [Deltaproteobacteria bacterium]|nr:MAG: hypothetical protein CSA21_00060 [Deltaproteobacteria bacterium]
MTASLPEFFASALPAISEEGRALLCRSVEPLSFTAGQQIFNRGESARGLYFLLFGRIGIRKETGFEDKTQVIALLDHGAPFGERGLLDGMTHGAGAVAVVDSTVALLPLADYVAFTEKMPADGRILLEWVLLQVSRRLEMASERLAHIL